jgi:hypothetical protein
MRDVVDTRALDINKNVSYISHKLLNKIPMTIILAPFTCVKDLRDMCRRIIEITAP